MFTQLFKRNRVTFNVNGSTDGSLTCQPVKYFILIQILLFSGVYSETITINGKISSNRIPIRNASVTFIDMADTTKKISALTDNSGRYRIDIVISNVSEAENIPETFELSQNYPKSISSSTAILYQLNVQSDVTITIYDVLGRRVRRFVTGAKQVGAHHIVWDGRDEFGNRVANGVYFYKIQSDKGSIVKKMTLDPSGSHSVVLSQNFHPALRKTHLVDANAFAIRVENTPATSPLLVPEEMEPVTIQNDTTINFYVEYTPLATFDFDSLHQIIQGYGAASPWYLPTATDSEIESAFGMDVGQIGLSIYRITVEADSNLWAKWIPSTRKAQDMGAKIIAAPWYAPDHLTEYRDGETRIKLDKYAEYADHLNSFVKFMEKNGVSIYGLSVQNEPEMGDWTNWSPQEMFTFMRDYAGAIKGTYVMSPEVSNFGRSYSDLILNDSTACANTDIICGHIYGGGLFEYPLAKEKGKEVWMTEYLMGENNSGNNMYWAMELAHNITNVMQADMSAYVWWTMIRYYGPIGDGNRAANPQDPMEYYPAKGEVTKKGYVLSQFSRFIHPGFFRVEGDLAPVLRDVDVTAYKHPASSKMVIVAVNSASSEKENAFRFNNNIITTTFTPYTTSENKNCEQGNPVDVKDGLFKYTLEPQSITTFVLQ
ncbi:MAG: FlgD immunoglobulin-like domain containing protein [candidate division KSB1 bacterium]|nr:FlgD immunoglobulin-like domain containing protein [candidate division KSB1 bacterium]